MHHDKSQSTSPCLERTVYRGYVGVLFFFFFFFFFFFLRTVNYNDSNTDGLFTVADLT